MKKFHLYMGNRLESLLDRLAAVMGEAPLSSPLAQEIIIVQSGGMQKWLSLRLADRLGVWTNCRYFFPNAFMDFIFSLVPDQGGPPVDAGYFQRDSMTWTIMRLLPALSGESGFEEIRNYIGRGDEHLKLWQLAVRIANTFDQYLIFRPDLIIGWEAGTERHWQARLWKAICDEAPAAHSARLRLDFLSRLAADGFALPDGFPERVTVFGIPALPPFHLDVIAALAGHIDAHVFFLNPCGEYWGDISSPAEQTRFLRKKRSPGVTGEDLHLEAGNGLLASMGRLGRDFLGLLLDINPPPPDELFTDNGAGGRTALLHSIQDDILHLREGNAKEGLDGRALQPTRQFIADGSITINSCHGPMREVEVLRDYLLDLFNPAGKEDSPIGPDDILVLAPDIDLYAPYIEAVFGSAPAGLHIPYAVADRTLRRENRLAGVFLSILDLADSRFEASRVADLLEHPEVHRRFGIQEEDLRRIRDWIGATRIRWAYDETGKERLGLPPLRQNTWRAGLDRMLLGFAMPGRDRAMFGSITPYDDIEGGDALLLGRFAEFVRSLHDVIASLDGSRPLTAWRDGLMEITDSLFAAEEGSLDDLRGIEEVLNRLAELASSSRHNGPVDFSCIRAHLEQAFGMSDSARNFFSGGVTFCAMLPMRSIPFRVICMIGMNDTAFPRQDRSPAFDLISSAPRRGDRSLREEDRYLFLEALISARERLYISYTGRSAADNSEIPPSVLVSELIDLIVRTLEGQAGATAGALVTRHSLQPFSPRYFSGDAPESYSLEDCRACAMMGRGESRRPFLTGPLPEGGAPDAIELRDLLAFFDNPARYLLRTRLGIFIAGGEEALSDSEPFTLDSLEAYGLSDELCRARVGGEDLELVSRVMVSKGLLPHGTPGELALLRMRAGADALAGRAAAFMAGEKLPPLRMSINIGGIALRGAIDNLWPDWHVRYRPTSLKAKDLLRAWILHLALGLAGTAGYPARTAVIAAEPSSGKRPATATFESPGAQRCRELLTGLVGVYLRGGMELIPLIPECSLEFAMRLREKGDLETALGAARAAWSREIIGGGWIGEYADAYYDICFARLDDGSRFGSSFREMSRMVFDPLLDLIREGE